MAADFSVARTMLARKPVASPVTLTLPGMAPDEVVTIERRGEEVRMIEDALAVRATDWRGGQHTAFENEARLAAMRERRGRRGD